MYSGMGSMNGLGFDWGSLVRSIGDVATGIVGRGPTVGTQYPTQYPRPTAQPAGMDLTTVALIGIGVFFLVKTLK